MNANSAELRRVRLLLLACGGHARRSLLLVVAKRRCWSTPVALGGAALGDRNERVGLEFICKTRSSVRAFALRPRSGSRPSAIPISPVATLAGIRH
jgi:hypothetical protein